MQKAKKDTRLIGKLKAILNTDIEHIERVCVSVRERDKKKREEKNERTTRKRVEFGLHLHLNDRSCDHSHKTVNAQHNIIYPREGKQSSEENEKAEKGKKGHMRSRRSFQRPSSLSSRLSFFIRLHTGEIRMRLSVGSIWKKNEKRKEREREERERREREKKEEIA